MQKAKASNRCINKIRVTLFLLNCASTTVNWFDAKHAKCVSNPQECFSFDETSSDRPTETETGRAKIIITLTSLIPADVNR